MYLRNLHLIDISSCVHTGKCINKTIDAEPRLNSAGRYYTPSIPIGGVSYLFNKINNIPEEDDIVFVADRQAVVKTEMYPNYKESRDFDEDIFRQKEIAERLLEDCGYLVLALEGYEADDLEYTLCKKYKGEYQHIYLHSDDSDMYIVVDENVTVTPVRSKGKEVTFENYSYTVRKNSMIPYNSLSWIKMIEGDKSDSIPKLPPNLERLAWIVYNKFTNKKLLGDYDFMLNYLSSRYPALVSSMQLLYPLTVEGIELPIQIPKGDMDRVMEWATVLQNRNFRRVPRLSKHVQELKNNIIETYLGV